MLELDPARELGGRATLSPLAEAPAGRLKALVVHHTHWDREWWSTYQEFRILLVELIDKLLDALDTDPSFRTFLLDGQTVVLRDYLEIRPENQERLVQRIREGRIECGPWYVLPDEFLVSGEAHIRNLLLGRRVAGDLGVPILAIGYLPDTFGHIGQMPQILRGFGIDNAFVWRGSTPAQQEVMWESPDGSRVLTHIFPNGYYQMPFLHFNNRDRPYEDKMGRIFGALDQLGSRASTAALLMPYGGDHQPIDPDLSGKIREAREAVRDQAEVLWGRLDEYLSAVMQESPDLATVNGELREFAEHGAHLLTGVLSTRLYLKRLNFAGQRWLERYAEPLQVLAHAYGRPYDRGLLWKAWELLIQNHPHDSICGCSIDQVHREMLTRFAQSAQIVEVLSTKSVRCIADRIDTSTFATGDTAAVVFNTLPATRSAFAMVELEYCEIDPHTHALYDSDGSQIPFSVHQVEGVRPLCDRWRHTQIRFRADNVPGLGYRTYRLTKRDLPLSGNERLFTAIQPVALLKGSKPITDLQVGRNTLENRYVKVEVDTTSGTLTVTDKASGTVYRGLNEFSDGGDAGDSYNYAEPLSDWVLRSSKAQQAHVSVTEASASRATLRVDLDWYLPLELSPDQLSRSSAYVATRLSSYVSVSSGSPVIEIETKWRNNSKDHRLRALFPLGARVDVSHAEGQFAVTKRSTGFAEPGNGWPEPPVPTMPQQGWVAIEAEGRGLMIANEGLPEFEIVGDESGSAIALTLLRAVGWLSRNDTPARVGGAGPELEAPDAQSLGEVAASYALIPYAGSWLESRAFQTAQSHLTPLYGASTTVHEGDLPLTGSLCELTGSHTLQFSSCKQAEDRDEVILRFWNVADEETTARLHVWRPAKAATLLDMKEEPLADGRIHVGEDGSVELTAGPAQILTVGIRF